VSDDRLRELRRAFEASPTRSNEVHYLQARLRSGELPAAQVEALAALGHPAARQVCPQSEPLARTATEWTVRLARLGGLAAARGAVACVDYALRRWRDSLGGEEATAHDVEAVALARRLQARAEAWLAGERADPLVERFDCRELYEREAWRWRDAIPRPLAASLPELALTATQTLPLGPDEVEEEWDHEVEFDRRLPFFEFVRQVASKAESTGRPGEGLDQASREVCRWVLGYDDALADRVERRRNRSGRQGRR
jgi:hypothetical protein